MAKLLFKSNFLRHIFEIGTPKFDNFDENVYRGATRSEQAGMSYSPSKAAEPFHLHWGGIKMDPKPNEFGTNLKRWGQRKHPEYKGSIYYRFHDALFQKKTIFSVGLFSEDSSFRKIQGGEPVIFFKGIQTPEKISVDDIRLNQTPGESNADLQKVPPEAPYLQRAFLLARRSYEQISTEAGITPKDNFKWAETLSDNEAVDMFNDQFSDLIIDS
jgi:hypothetical protein